jgi:hypothetical protein
MRAHAGDWLVVETATVGRHCVRGRIEEVADPAGAPPFRVRWTDDDRVTMVFPGPDARVLTQHELAELDRQRAERFGLHAAGTDRS